MADESFPLHRSELVDVRLAIPALEGSIKNARRLSTALALNTDKALNQLELDAEEIKAKVGGGEDNPNGCRLMAPLRRTLRIALGIHLGRLGKAEEADLSLDLDTSAVTKRKAAVEKMIRRLEDQLDAIDSENEEEQER